MCCIAWTGRERLKFRKRHFNSEATEKLTLDIVENDSVVSGDKEIVFV